MKNDTIYVEGSPNFEIEIDLDHVRASDGIRVIYDLVRDGWVIKQPRNLEVTHDERNPLGCVIVNTWGEEILTWHEVAFIKSWTYWTHDA